MEPALHGQREPEALRQARTHPGPGLRSPGRSGEGLPRTTLLSSLTIPEAQVGVLPPLTNLIKVPPWPTPKRSFRWSPSVGDSLVAIPPLINISNRAQRISERPMFRRWSSDHPSTPHGQPSVPCPTPLSCYQPCLHPERPHPSTGCKEAQALEVGGPGPLQNFSKPGRVLGREG